MACFMVSAASYVPFIGVALWILPRRSSSSRHADALPWPKSVSGIREILRQRLLLGALSTVLITGILCAPLLTFIPVLVKEVFKGAGQFSAAVASFGIGGLIFATGLLSVPPSADRRKICSGFGAVHGLALLLTAINPWFWALPALLALAGAAMTVSNTAANSLLQATRARGCSDGRSVFICSQCAAASRLEHCSPVALSAGLASNGCSY